MPFSEKNIVQLIDGFESGTWPAAEFGHAAHVTVAAWYILNTEDALDQLRARIPVYNVRQGNANTPDSGYHETLTVFWFHVISDFLADLPAGTGKTEAIQAAVEHFGSTRSLFRAYYDFDIVKSQTARAEWIPPSAAPKARQRWLARELSTVPA